MAYTAESIMFASIDQDLTRVDEITDTTHTRRLKILEKMDNAISSLKIGTADNVSADDVETDIKVVTAYTKLLDSIDQSAMKRAALKLKKGEVDNMESSSEAVGAFLKKLTPGSGVMPLPSEVMPFAAADQMLDDRLRNEGIVFDGNKLTEVPEPATRVDPTDYR